MLYPIESFVQLVENVDVLYVKVFDCVKHNDMTSILSLLYCNILDTTKDFLNCDKVDCNIKFASMIKLYIRIRMFHSLKMSTVQTKTIKG